MPNQEPAELARAFRQGDTQAFDKIVECYQTKIYNLAFNYVKQSEEAKDLTQDIFITIYQSISKLRDETKFSAWLYQVAINHCRNRYKKLQRKGFFNSRSINDPESPLQLSSGQSTEKEFERKNTIKMVRTAIAAMPKGEKEVLLLRDIQELSYEEVSVILNIPLGTVKSRLSRARTALKDKLKVMIQQV